VTGKDIITKDLCETYNGGWNEYDEVQDVLVIEVPLDHRFHYMKALVQVSSSPSGVHTGSGDSDTPD
jgi:hypothetical protein